MDITDFCQTQLFTQSFLGGIIGNLTASVGYDGAKASINHLGPRLGEVFRQGGEFKNHDLMRAHVFAQCQAVVAVCEVCLLEDYKAEPTLILTLVRGNLLRLLDGEVRDIAKVREWFADRAKDVVQMPLVKLEALMAMALEDTNALVAAGAEIAAADSEGDLRKRSSEKVRVTLNNVAQLETKSDAPAALLARFDRHWFDLVRASFRETLKDDKFEKARRAFELDVLSQLAEGVPRSLAALEARVSVTDQKLERVIGLLETMRVAANEAQANQLHAEFHAAFAAWQQQLSAQVGRIEETVTRTDATTTQTAADVADLKRAVAQIERELQSPVANAEALSAELPPPRPKPFLGRDAELKELVAALLAASPNAVIVHGGAGMGKTSLTVMAYHEAEVAARFGERRFFVRCETAPGYEALVQQIGRQLELGQEAYKVKSVIAALAAAPVLLVLDNLETPWQGEQQRVEEFVAALAELPTVTLLVSLRGDELPSQPEWSRQLRPRIFDLATAREVCLKIAPQCAELGKALDDLLEKIEGVPLAVTLLAHEAKSADDVHSLPVRWQQARTKMLQRGAGDHRTSSWQYSLQLSLDSPQMQRNDHARRLFAVLSLLPSGLAGEDLTALLPDDGLEAAVTLKKLALASTAEGRLRMLNPIREFGQQNCPPDPADLARAIKHYTELAMLGERVGEKGGSDAIHRLTPEAPNLEAMLLRGLATDDWERAAEAAILLSNFTGLTGIGTNRILLSAAERAEAQENHFIQADCIFVLGINAFVRWQYEEARARYEQALPLYRQVGSVLGEANCIWGLGDIALANNDEQSAGERFDAALQLYERIPEPDSIGQMRLRLALLADSEVARAGHVQAARQAWQSINRPDLVQELDEEFGASPPTEAAT